MSQSPKPFELRAEAALTTTFVDTDKSARIASRDSVVGVFTYTPNDTSNATGFEVEVWLSELESPTLGTDAEWYQLTREEDTAASGTRTAYPVTYVFPIDAGASNGVAYKRALSLAVGDRQIKFKVRETGAGIATAGDMKVDILTKTLGANG